MKMDSNPVICEVAINQYLRLVLEITAKKGCYYFGAQVFNNLPSSIKETESLFISNTIIKDIFSENS